MKNKSELLVENIRLKNELTGAYLAIWDNYRIYKYEMFRCAFCDAFVEDSHVVKKRHEEKCIVIKAAEHLDIEKVY